ncbi:hypothetical protein BaRGS_00028636, partial [Batillaria attramentaria]
MKYRPIEFRSHRTASLSLHQLIPNHHLETPQGMAKVWHNLLASEDGNTETKTYVAFSRQSVIGSPREIPSFGSLEKSLALETSLALATLQKSLVLGNPPEIPSSGNPPEILSFDSPPEIPSSDSPPEVHSSGSPPKIHSSDSPPEIPGLGSPPEIPSSDSAGEGDVKVFAFTPLLFQQSM